MPSSLLSRGVHSLSSRRNRTYHPSSRPSSQPTTKRTTKRTTKPSLTKTAKTTTHTHKVHAVFQVQWRPLDSDTWYPLDSDTTTTLSSTKHPSLLPKDIIQWYTQQWTEPYEDDHFKPIQIQMRCLNKTTHMYRITFVLQSKQFASTKPPMRHRTRSEMKDVKDLFIQMLIDPDDDGNHLLNNYLIRGKRR